MEFLLGELADYLKTPLRGDPKIRISHVTNLMNADPHGLTFLGDPKLRRQLELTNAGAVILTEKDAAAVQVPVLISNNPYLTFAQAARILHPDPVVTGGIHPTAVIDPAAIIDPTAWIGPFTVLEAEVQIGARVFVGSHCILGEKVIIGADSRLIARVTLCAGTQIGERALLHPGAVIGREGFGFAKDGERWIKIPQIGRVIVGDDVEIGANTVIDRGTISDTLIGNGVKLDNNIHIGHNVEIGDNTALAANTGIAGSTRIGRNCTVAGAVGIAGHLEIGDQVHFTGMAMVTRSVKTPGIYSSGIPAISRGEWRRNAVRFKHLDQLARRLQDLEKDIATMNQTNKQRNS